MGIVHMKLLKRRFFENHYSYSVYLNCGKRPLQVGCPAPKHYEYEYDSYLRKTLATSRHHSVSSHTCSVATPPPSPTLGLSSRWAAFRATYTPHSHMQDLQGYEGKTWWREVNIYSLLSYRTATYCVAQGSMNALRKRRTLDTGNYRLYPSPVNKTATLGYPLLTRTATFGSLVHITGFTWSRYDARVIPTTHAVLRSPHHPHVRITRL